MAILAAVLLANMSSAAKRGRDAGRQADLRNLQNAIEAYKHKNGQYPLAGCGASSGQWGTEKKCDTFTDKNYIIGLAPDFIPRLPHDPVRGSNEGYSYVTNAAQTVYKIMAMNTVEVDTIDYNHPFKSCDIRPDNLGRFQFVTSTGIDVGGWCAYVVGMDGTPEPEPDRCKLSSDNGNGRFDKSYGLWGGYADEGKGTALLVKKTTSIICK